MIRIVKLLSVAICSAAMLTGLTGCSGLAMTALPVSPVSKDAITSKFMTEYNKVVYKTLTSEQKSCYEIMLNGFKGFRDSIRMTGSRTDIETAYNAIVADHPELFYVSGYVYNSRSSIFAKESAEAAIYPNYSKTAAEYRDLMKAIDLEADEWLRELPEGSDDYEKSEFLFRKIVEWNSYSGVAEDGQDLMATFLTGEAVCGGYSQGYSYVMQKAGIPCATLTGTLDNVSHAWNAAVLDNDVYITDSTNGDSSYTDITRKEKEYIDFSYLNMNPEWLTDYKFDEVFSGIVPVAKKNNYFARHDRYFDMYSNDLTGKVLKSADKDTLYLSIAYGSAEALQSALNDLFNDKKIQELFPDAGAINYLTTSRSNVLTVFIPETSMVSADERS